MNLLHEVLMKVILLNSFAGTFSNQFKAIHIFRVFKSNSIPQVYLQVHGVHELLRACMCVRVSVCVSMCACASVRMCVHLCEYVCIYVPISCAYYCLWALPNQTDHAID